MGFKAIKQHYDIGYIVAIYNEEKYGGDCICIGSGFVHGLIAINIETGKVFYSSLVTPGENSEIGQPPGIMPISGEMVTKAKIRLQLLPIRCRRIGNGQPRNPGRFRVELLGYGSYRSEGFAFRLLGRCKKEFPPAAGRRRRGLSVLLQSRRIDNRSRFAG